MPDIYTQDFIITFLYMHKKLKVLLLITCKAMDIWLKQKHFIYLKSYLYKDI